MREKRDLSPPPDPKIKILSLFYSLTVIGVNYLLVFAINNTFMVGWEVWGKAWYLTVFGTIPA